MGRLKEKCEIILGKMLLGNDWSEVTQKCAFFFFKIMEKRFLLNERMSAKNKRAQGTVRGYPQ